MDVRRALRTAAITIVAVPLFGAAGAHAAATVSTTGFPEFVSYQAAPGTVNRPTFRCDFFSDGMPDTCVIHDFEGVTSGAGCVQDSSTQVTCTAHLGTEQPLRATLGDLDDIAVFLLPFVPVGVEVDAGPGDDSVELSSESGTDVVTLGTGDDWFQAGYGNAAAHGNGGKDTMVGAGLFDTLQGDDGNDTLLSSVAGTAALYGGAGRDYMQGGRQFDQLFGGLGDDSLDGGRGPDQVDGGPGFDTADYGSRTENVSVSFNRRADDGAPVYDGWSATADKDNISSTVENVISGSGHDTLTAGSTAVVFQAGSGNDRLVGSNAADILLGEAGNDTLQGRLGADTLDGGPGGGDEITYDERSVRIAVRLDGLRNDGADPNANRISAPDEENDLDIAVERARGGTVGDYLQGNALINRLLSGGGDDDVKSRDGTSRVDTVDCGVGVNDRVDADPSDTRVACEATAVFP